MAKPLLSHINTPEDLRELSQDQLPLVATELREFILDVVAAKAGHLGASLGVVELTLALHYVFNTPEDLLVWDVGHQAYGHKIITGRRDVFETNRQLDGLSGFPKRDESPFDTFGVGHSSTAISAALGMALAAKLNDNTQRQHIAVVGDASIASGMAFEGLNHAGVTDANLLIVLNDNAIGIDPSVGALKEYLLKVAVGTNLSQDNIFEALNFNYSGPIDGHNINSLCDELARLKQLPGPKVLHVITTKGKGLKQAELDQVRYHAPGKFDRETGNIPPVANQEDQPEKFQDVFGKTILDLAHQNSKIIGITPAMPTGSSLKFMMEVYPERALDVGIAEQHAVTLAAGMATQGMFVYCNIYSTFLQRAYDQVIHDVCLQNLPVVFCLDRAGIVGEDGPTHHGIFDIAYLRCIPNLTVYAPASLRDLQNILFTAQKGLNGPIAIRYPRGRGFSTNELGPYLSIAMGKGKQVRRGENIAILTIGTMRQNAQKAIDSLDANIGLYDMQFVSPLDQDLLNNILSSYEHIITIEDGVIQGGFGSAVLEYASTHNYHGKIHLLGIDGHFPAHGTIDQLQEIAGYSASKIVQKILTLLDQIS
ncbi:MAG: 1-deoxy-D-xylulose-5-phosphate synthase [Gilvibacter sp.]